MTKPSSYTATGSRLLAAAVACALLWPAAVAGQANPPPLADVARKEAERRKTVKTSKTITTKDLPESARKPAGTPATGTPSGTASAAPSGAHGAAPAGDAKAPEPAQQGPQKDEGYWRGRLSAAQEGLRRSQAFADALQSRINALTTDFVNRDDPYQRAKIGEDRVNALAELDRVKGEIENFKRQLVDIEEEARKAGVPPGWLR